MGDKIIPNCRYGHGDLVREVAGGNKDQLFMIETSPKVRTEVDGLPAYKIYSFALYKCTKCTYLELHDVA